MNPPPRISVPRRRPGGIFLPGLAPTLAALALAAVASAAEAPPSPVREVIVVCKTHFDIGYTHRVKDLIPYYRTTMIDRALAAMDDSASLPPEQQFAWTAPAWVMSKVMDDWDGQSPDRRAKLEAAFRSGKFLTHALPFTLESDACEPEEMARGLSFASDLTKRYNLARPCSAKLTDVPGHAGALATVLARGGVKFLHIGCNWPSGFVRTPGLFWWEGPDGSRVLTMYSPIYGTCTALWPKDWLGKDDPNYGKGLLPPPGWNHRTWPAIIVTPDNSGPPKASEIKALFDEAARALPGVKFRMGTLDDFAQALLAENPDLPVVRGDMADTWIHGVMSDPGGMALSREVHPALSNTEALRAQLQVWGSGLPEASDQIAKAYENILLYGEHTWGGAAAVNTYGEAFSKLPPGKFADLEGSWEDKTNYIREAGRITGRLRDEATARLATSVTHPSGTFVVYNPLPWTRSGLVEIHGEPVFAKNVPACGYLALSDPPATSRVLPPTQGEPGTIENSFFRLTLDPAKGTITSLIDKRTGREWVEAAAAPGLGQYLNERFTFEQTLDYTLAYQQGRAMGAFGAKGDWPHPGMHKPGMIPAAQSPYRADSPSGGLLSVEKSSTLCTATLDLPAAPGRHLPASTLKVVLPNDLPYIELEITIRDKAKDNWPEADWLCLPFKVAHPTFRVARPLGTMDPTRDLLPGANRHLHSVGHGVTVTDGDGGGIAVCPLDHPLVSLGEPGCWKFSQDYVPTKPVVYLNLYNNQWNTNFRYWYPGTWKSRVRLWTFDKSTPPPESLAVPALEARNPLTACVGEARNPSLPATQSGLSVSRKGVAVTMLRKNPAGAGFQLRIWEQAGTGGEVIVTLPKGLPCAHATPVDLRGEKAGDPLAVSDGAFTVRLGPFAPATFVLD